jgi:hypothetical protein
MSLSAWEQQALDCIEYELVGSDPKLAWLLATFARHASAEELPVREKIPNLALRRGNVRRPGHSPRPAAHQTSAGQVRRATEAIAWLTTSASARAASWPPTGENPHQSS